MKHIVKPVYLRDGYVKRITDVLHICDMNDDSKLSRKVQRGLK